MGDSKRGSLGPSGEWGKVRGPGKARNRTGKSASRPCAVPSAGAQEPSLPAVGAVVDALEAWFPGQARDLPWRRRRTGWKALVSEVLLQQTQVARVAERFPEFMRLFPTPRAMVDAGEAAVLRAWRGLGYYRRARSLHAAACAIVERHGGRVPSDPATLRSLPGVGRYTAGAVASIAFGRREPIVDGNVMRVLSRLADRRTPAADAEGQAWCWEGASRLVQAAADPAILNESLMELGATVCTPAAPRCPSCPLRACCRSRRAGSQSMVPPPKRPPDRRTLVLHALVQLGPGGVALERRTQGLWRGLLCPPLVEAPRKVSSRFLKKASGASRVGVAATEVPFQTTHRSIHFVVHPAAFASDRGLRWIPASALTDEALPSAALRIIEAVMRGRS